MKLREKIMRVGTAAVGMRGPDRVTMVAGLFWLAFSFAIGVRILVLLPRREYLNVVGYAANLPILLTFWAEARRKAVDLPMGEAWFNLPATRHVLAASYAVLTGVSVLAGSWGWAAIDAILAVFWWCFNPGGGGGWDDPVDAPHPDPSTSA